MIGTSMRIARARTSRSWFGKRTQGSRKVRHNHPGVSAHHDDRQVAHLFLPTFRKAYCEIPKKNGKSTLASGIGLYLLCGDGEAGAEVYSLATDRDQANIVHGEAVHLLPASSWLCCSLRIRLGLQPKSPA